MDNTELTVEAPRMRLLSPAAGEAAALLSMIERAALDPRMDVDRLERMWAMYEKVAARAAKAAYLTALAEMQPTLPVVDKRGRIERGQDKSGKERKASPYVRYEDAIEAINPALHAHGFSLSFRIAQPEPGRVLVTGVLGHRDGHSEETSLSLPMDDSGGKTNVQGWGSSVSYGKRYTAFALLNIVARGEDDDGHAPSAPAATITEDQAADLRDALEASGGLVDRFCAYWKIGSLGELPAEKYAAAVTSIQDAARRRANGR